MSHSYFCHVYFVEDSIWWHSFGYISGNTSNILSRAESHIIYIREDESKCLYKIEAVAPE